MASNKDNDIPGGVDEVKNKGQTIRVPDIEIAMRMLTTYLNPDEIRDLLTALEELKDSPQSEQVQNKVVTAFNELGSMQGAVLTYAPYLNVFVSDDPFADR